MPSPISDFATRTVTLLSGSITNHALISVGRPVFPGSFVFEHPGKWNASMRPPADEVATRTKFRRFMSNLPRKFGRSMNRGPDPLIRTAPTNVVDRRVNLFIVRIGVIRQ